MLENTPEEVIDLFLIDKWGKDYKEHYISKVKRTDMLEKMMKNKILRNKVNGFQTMDDSQFKQLVKNVMGLA